MGVFPCSLEVRQRGNSSFSVLKIWSHCSNKSYSVLNYCIFNYLTHTHYHKVSITSHKWSSQAFLFLPQIEEKPEFSRKQTSSVLMFLSHGIYDMPHAITLTWQKWKCLHSFTSHDFFQFFYVIYNRHNYYLFHIKHTCQTIFSVLLLYLTIYDDDCSDSWKNVTISENR